MKFLLILNLLFGSSAVFADTECVRKVLFTIWGQPWSKFDNLRRGTRVEVQVGDRFLGNGTFVGRVVNHVSNGEHALVVHVGRNVYLFPEREVVVKTPNDQSVDLANTELPHLENFTLIAKQKGEDCLANSVFNCLRMLRTLEKDTDSTRNFTYDEEFLKRITPLFNPRTDRLRDEIRMLFRGTSRLQYKNLVRFLSENKIPFKLTGSKEEFLQHAASGGLAIIGMPTTRIAGVGRYSLIYSTKLTDFSPGRGSEPRAYQFEGLMMNEQSGYTSGTADFHAVLSIGAYEDDFGGRTAIILDSGATSTGEMGALTFWNERYFRDSNAPPNKLYKDVGYFLIGAH